MGVAAAGAFGTLGFHGWAGTAGGVVARAVSLGLARSACCFALAEREWSRADEPLACGVPDGASGAAWAAAANRSSSERASAFKRASSAMRRASARRARTSSSLGPRAG